MTVPSNADQDDFGEELALLLKLSARTILKHTEPAPYLAWATNYMPQLAPTLFGMVEGGEASRQVFARILGRAIWNATPLPGNDFRPQPLPQPGRNDPCFCDSGIKYKRCCGLAARLPLPVTTDMMLIEVLNQWPASKLGVIPHDRLSPEVLGHVASEWLDAGQPERARKLIEPLFADVNRLDARAEVAFDTLANAYLALQQPRKKAALYERVATARSPDLRAAALQRHCTALFDAGRQDGAWQVFRRAQRECPDHPAFGMLETMLLFCEGRAQEAAERAKFWVARLSRQDADGYDEQISYLREIAADPGAAMMKVSDLRTPGLARLEALVAALDLPAQSLYELDRDEDGQVSFMPVPAGQTLIEAWYGVFPPLSAMLTSVEPEGPYVWEPDVADAWLEFLEANPRAFGVIEILDGIVFALRQLPDGGLAWVSEKIVVPLLIHAQRVFDQALAAHGAEAARVPWFDLRNRPALRLLANRIYLCLDDDALDTALPLMERMVYTLNTNDNHGLREPLSRVYLALDQPEKVLALRARYPDDHFAAMAWNEVLALHRLGHYSEAAAAAVEAKRVWPNVYRYLCSAAPAQPRLTPGMISSGGRDEAWYYRETHLPQWRKGGALDWLKSVAKSRTARRTPETA